MPALGTRLLSRFAATALLVAISMSPNNAVADEGGTSFWLPGTFASLAATLQEPGWSVTSLYTHASASAGGDVTAARQVTIGGLGANVKIDLSANFHTKT